MTSSVLQQLATTFSILSLGAVGGANATLPELHRQMVSIRHYMDDATFASLVAIAQTAPGPNVTVMSLMGWYVAGLAGLAVATLGMIAPSSTLVFAAERIFRRFSSNRALLVLKMALAPIAVGLLCSSGFMLGRVADSGALTIAITIAMTLLCGLTRINPLYGIASGALIALAIGPTGIPL